MPIIAIASEKGGTGKSTVAVCVASELHARGHRVIIADGDPQGTSYTWHAIGRAAGHDIPPVIALTDNTRPELLQAASQHEWVIVDVAGRIGRRAAGALIVADLLVIPTLPAPADVWTLASVMKLVDDVRGARSAPLPAYVLLNRVGRTAIEAAAIDAIRSTGINVMRTRLGARAAYPEAMNAGRGVQAKTKAAAEVRALSRELVALTSKPEAKKGKR